MGPAMPPRKSLWCEWAEKTSWHGILQLHSASFKISKFVWTLFSAFCFCQICYQTYLFVEDFVKGRAWVTRVAFVQRNGLELPNVTLCNFHMWNLTKVEQHRIEPYELKIITQTMRLATDQQYSVQYHSSAENLTATYRDVKEKMGNPDDLMERVKNSLAMGCEGTFISCRWPSRRGNFNCCNHVVTVKSQGHICLTLMVPALVSTRDGNSYVEADSLAVANDPWSILRLVLNPASAHGTKDPESGFALHLNFAGSDEFIVPNPIFLSPKTHSRVYMHMEEKSLVYSPGINDLLVKQDLPCEEDRVLKYVRGAYSYQNCLQECNMKYFDYYCGCSPGGPLRNEEGKLVLKCTPLDMLLCDRRWSLAAQANESETQNESEDDLGTCIQECKPLCRQKIIRSQSMANSLDLSDNTRSSFLTGTSQPPIRPLDLPPDALFVDISYDRMEIMVVETVPRVTPDGLLSSIGGVMGVWAGMSLVTLIEAGTYIFYAIFKFAASLFRDKSE